MKSVQSKKETGDVKRATLSADPKQAIEWIQSLRFPLPMHTVYESGPTGFILARALIDAGIECVVCATSKLPACKDRKKMIVLMLNGLRGCLMQGSVHEVRIPSRQEESLRDLSRLRNETTRDLTRAKLRVSSFLLLRNIKAPGKMKRWSVRWREWAEKLGSNQPLDAYVFSDKLAEVYRVEERLLLLTPRSKRPLSQTQS